MLPHTIIFNTVSELYDLLDNHETHTLVNRAAFGLDLLDRVRDNDNIFNIERPVDDGRWIEVDDDGYVVRDFL